MYLAKHVPEAQIAQKYAETVKDVIHSSLKTICAFLNSKGGTLLIGVTDTGVINGLERDCSICPKQNKDGFELKLRDLLSSRLKPQPVGNIDITFEELAEGTVCVVDVPSIPKLNIIHLDNEVFIRDGNRTRKLEGLELTKWIADRVRV